MASICKQIYKCGSKICLDIYKWGGVGVGLGVWPGSVLCGGWDVLCCHFRFFNVRGKYLRNLTTRSALASGSKTNRMSLVSIVYGETFSSVDCLMIQLFH